MFDRQETDILSVNICGFSGFPILFTVFSLLSIPVNKMAEWVKKKAVGQDHVFVGPITTDSSPHKRDNAHTSDIESLNFRNGKWNMSQQESDVRGIQPVHYQADYNHKISKGDDNVLESKVILVLLCYDLTKYVAFGNTLCCLKLLILCICHIAFLM